jgi:hypothetical protein
MNVLIVYYGNESSTAKVTKGLAQATRGTVRQLVDKRTAGLGSMVAALLGLGTRLVGADYDVNGRDVVVFMTPCGLAARRPA